MRLKRKCLCLVLLIICVVVLILTNKPKQVEFGDFKWVVVKNNVSRVEDRTTGKTILSGEILLWGEYPLLVGQIEVSPFLPQFFIYDCKAHVCSLFPDNDSFQKQSGYSVPLNNLVTLQTLLNPELGSQKLRILADNMKDAK